VFLGADDVLDCRLLEAQLDGVRGVPNGVACTGFAFFIGDVSRAFKATMPRANAFFPAIITGNLAPASCWLTPKSLILQAGCYHSEQTYFEDWDLWWRVGLTGAVYVPVQMVGFYYRQHATSQLATAHDADRAYGHGWLMERMCRAFLDRPDLLQAHGERLFWAACAALRACRAHAVPWDRLRLLGHMIEEVAHRRPPGLQGSMFARAVRLVGVRRAMSATALLNGPDAAPVYRPAWMRRDEDGPSAGR